MREYQYIPHPETLELEMRHRPALMLDQTTPQNVVPIAGTTFSLSSYDALPNIAPGAFVIPVIGFTNSNLVGFSEYIGAIRGGILTYPYDGNESIMGVIYDLEASQYGIMGYDSTNSTFDISVNGSNANAKFGAVSNSGGTYYPVLGGMASDGMTKGLFFDTFIGMWDSAGTGSVAILGVSQDFSNTSFILAWNSVTEVLSYSGEGGMVINTTGWTEGTTSTPLTLSFQSLGDGHDNDGLRLEFKHRSDQGTFGTAYTAGYIDCIQTDASATTMDDYIAIGGVTAGSSAEWLRLTGLLGTFSTDLKVVTGTNTSFETDELTIDLGALIPDLEITIPILKATSYSNDPGSLPFPYAVGVYDRLGVFAQGTFDNPEILFAYPDFSNSASIGADLVNNYIWVNWDFAPADDNDWSLGTDTLRWLNGYFLGDINIMADTSALILGAGADMSAYYDGTDGHIKTDLVAASDLKIDCGTDKTLVLEESVWDDIQFATSTGKVSSSNAPDFDTFTTNTKEYKFDVDDYIYLEANELAHWWKEGTTVYPHVHATLNGANVSGSSQYAKFTIYFAYADANEVWTETSDTVEIEIPTGSADMKHFLGSGAGVALANNKIGSQIKVTLKRIAATTGTEYPNHIFVTQTGLHAEGDTMGSRQISTK